MQTPAFRDMLRLRREIAHAEMVNRVSDAFSNLLTREAVVAACRQLADALLDQGAASIAPLRPGTSWRE